VISIPKRRALLKLDDIERVLLNDKWKFIDSYKGGWEYSKDDMMAVVLFGNEVQRNKGVVLNPSKDLLEISVDKVNKNDIKSALMEMKKET
jgi:hypothetical protein